MIFHPPPLSAFVMDIVGSEWEGSGLHGAGWLRKRDWMGRLGGGCGELT